VVCVMTTGQEWQFKPYKWKEPKELFHNGTSEHSHLFFRSQGRELLICVACWSLAVKGVYPQWTADPPNAKIRSWNVSELRVRSSVPLTRPPLDVTDTLPAFCASRSTRASATLINRRSPTFGDSSRAGSKPTSRGCPSNGLSQSYRLPIGPELVKQGEEDEVSRAKRNAVLSRW
jgi:hypothetical protein